MPLKRRRRRTQATDLNPIVELWLLRILVPLGGHHEFLRASCFSSDSLATSLGLAAWIDDEERAFAPAAVLAELRQLHRSAEAAHAGAALPPTLSLNMARLAQLAGLSETDCRVLEFATLLHSEPMLTEAADTLGSLSSVKTADVLARLLGLQVSKVRAALAPDGVLARSGLLAVDRTRNADLHNKLDLLSQKFADHILAAEADPIALLRDIVSPSTPPALALQDYAHIGDALEIMLPYLRNAVATGRKGVNIFLHGAPGTGKSELARVLAAGLGCELFEVSSEDEDGDPITGERRLRAYAAAQSFFGQRHALILFDEVEDVFNDGDGLFRAQSTAQRRKAWLNRTLEQNAVPTLWLSNSSGLDPAFVRRFDMVCELPVPPRAQRERILRDSCGDLLDAAAIARAAGAEQLAPAVVSRAASVVRSIRGELEAPAAARAMEWLMNRTLEAQGHQPMNANSAARLPDSYDPALLNTEADLQAIAAGLARSRSARICLYGPPGTGKTAYGRWLAEQLDMPLVLRSASDLMSKWVGENEKNIARAFRSAERESAILMIDEVDSFLQDRGKAGRSWEVTMVNEMLTRMEAYSGIFIASTNLMDGLDPAALRRFDLKLRFGYLQPAQAERLLLRTCAGLGLQAPDDASLQMVRTLGSVTPGDVAAMVRRHRFAPFSDGSGLAHALQQECSLKGEASRKMGFLY